MPQKINNDYMQNSAAILQPGQINISAPGIKEPNSKKNYLDLTALIRSIQRAEGASGCYKSKTPGCDKLDCAWREHCIGTAEF